MYNIVVFGYNFKHKKSEDFLHILKKNKINIVAYIAADTVTLNLPNKVYNKSIPEYTIYHPKDLCEQYNIPFFNESHNSEESKKIILNANANIGIISGARILKESIINLLEYGIVNFHPGKIPEASGLDGLFWSIYKDISPFVTTHFIDKNVDAGKIIYSKKVDVLNTDKIENLKYRISMTEKIELENLCKDFLINKKEISTTNLTDYISANKPMDESTQEIVLKKFDEWKKKYYEN